MSEWEINKVRDIVLAQTDHEKEEVQHCQEIRKEREKEREKERPGEGERK